MTPIVVLLAIVAIAQCATGVLLWRSRPKPVVAPTAKHPQWDGDVRDSRIAKAIREQLAYEEEHAERQQDRLKHLRHDRHGEYDSDQRAQSVLLKVQRAYSLAGEALPPDLLTYIHAALRDAT